jgi:hypothetical protein
MPRAPHGRARLYPFNPDPLRPPPKSSRRGGAGTNFAGGSATVGRPALWPAPRRRAAAAPCATGPVGCGAWRLGRPVRGGPRASRERRAAGRGGGGRSAARGVHRPRRGRPPAIPYDCHNDAGLNVRGPPSCQRGHDGPGARCRSAAAGGVLPVWTGGLRDVGCRQPGGAGARAGRRRRGGHRAGVPLAARWRGLGAPRAVQARRHHRSFP